MGMDAKIGKTMESLRRNGFKAAYFETAVEAKKALTDLVGETETAAMGGSMTVTDLGLKGALAEKGVKLWDHMDGKDARERTEILTEASKTDVYFSSVNALTTGGVLLNIDGSGNRVSGTLFGHKRVYFVAGVNKIVGDVQEGLVRMKTVAAPLNAKRLNKNTPCARTGKCGDCNSPDRICRATVILERAPIGADHTVFLIGESMGY
jgi:L-lactate utilization protein LutB